MRTALKVMLQDYSAMSKRDPRKAAADFYQENTKLAKKIIKDFEINITTKEAFNDFILTFHYFVESGLALLAGYVDKICLSFTNHNYNFDHVKYLYDARLVGALIAHNNNQGD